MQATEQVNGRERERVKMFHRIFVNYLCSLALSIFFVPVFNQVSNLKFRERKITLN